MSDETSVTFLSYSATLPRIAFCRLSKRCSRRKSSCFNAITSVRVDSRHAGRSVIVELNSSNFSLTIASVISSICSCTPVTGLYSSLKLVGWAWMGIGWGFSISISSTAEGDGAVSSSSIGEAALISACVMASYISD